MKTRKVPMRMCMGCRTRRPKRELVRVVRTPEGEICLDATGKKSGRGTYVCADNPVCLEKSIKTRALERSLEHPIDDTLYQALSAELAKHIKEAPHVEPEE
ncbi:MAG: YlxR family protein [Eubacteriales bacterium]|nr:YlxR family protein [Eubacteriales bacterium]